MWLLTIETPDGPYRLHAQYVVACDGARSSLRQMVGAEFAGQVFEDQFLIADVKMTAAFPTERWFWFDPPFHAGRSALLHKQPDDIWRIDLQLSPDADPAVEKLPENVRPRIARMLGHDKFDFEWISLYKFQCRRMDKFVHGRVIFAGDAAHQVSPFGARGANSGLEDAENLAWKLDRVLRGTSPEALLESYHTERSAAADENIRESTRSTDFMAPQFAPGGAAAQGGAVARQGNRVRQAHGQWRAAVGAVDLRHAALDRRWRCLARRPAARRVDAGCAGCRPGRRADVPDRSLHHERERGSRCWRLAMARRSEVPEGRGRDPHRRRWRLCRCRRACRRALRRRTRHRLSAAARRLCRGAVPASDPCRRSTRRWRAPPASTEVSSWRYRPASNFAKPDDAFRAIVEAHRGLSETQSADLDAALVLVLANHIGDIAVLHEAIALAKRRMLDASQTATTAAIIHVSNEVRN